MKTMRIFLSLAFTLGLFVTAAQAAERENFQKAYGGLQTDDAVIVGSAQVITGIAWDSTSSASTLSLYDTTTLGGTTNANGIWEGGSAANTSGYVLFDPPIRTRTGVTLVAANIDGAVIMTEQSWP